MRPWRHRPAVRRGEAGFSLIEALIAAAILLIIALGLLPVFSRSINDNVTGNDATQATNGSRTELEEMLQLPFNNQRMVVAGGETQTQTKDFYTRAKTDPSTGAYEIGDATEGWTADASGRGPVLWNRTTTVQQYGITDLNDGKLDTPLDGSTQANFVHLKQIQVLIENPKKDLFGNGQGITLTVIKAF
ncbi:MAG TPA: prepilin-type N-terminal cleavage/methylation domain-containing protein [Thermoanaerobaculia bacterium]|jgi:Tfp pilus assembly protein PilV